MKVYNTTERECYLTCKYCANPLSDNNLVKDAYKINNVKTGVNNRLKVLIDMIADNPDRDIDWVKEQLIEIKKNNETYNLKF